MFRPDPSVFLGCSFWVGLYGFVARVGKRRKKKKARKITHSHFAQHNPHEIRSPKVFRYTNNFPFGVEGSRSCLRFPAAAWSNPAWAP
jgi:hypothetical protein